jgi:hypothetical protein
MRQIYLYLAHYLLLMMMAVAILPLQSIPPAMK